MEQHTLSQYMSGLAAGLSVLAVGCTTGWTTVALKKLKSKGSPIPVTNSEASWIASCHELGHILSPVPSGYVVDWVGRKKCLVFSALVQCLGWALIVATKSVSILYLIRFLFGISMGIVFTVAPLYIAEISSPDIRGALSTGFESALYLGHLVEFSIGPYVDYDVLGYISATIPLIFLVLTIWMVESPYYLVKISEVDRAKAAYSRLTGDVDTVSVNQQMNEIEEHVRRSEQRVTLGELFGSTIHRRSLMVVLVLAIVQRFSGMSAMVAYASLIFPDTIGGLSSSSYTILFGVITLLFTFVSAALMDRSGRRVLTIVSCLGSFVVELATAAYFYTGTSQFSWLPFVTISAYAGFYSIGLGPIVTTVQGELFPPSVKGLAGSIVTIVHAVAGSLVTKCYQIISDHFGVYVSFLFFSLNCLIGSLFAYFAMPETKGKTLLEIQRL